MAPVTEVSDECGQGHPWGTPEKESTRIQYVSKTRPTHTASLSSSDWARV